MLAVCAPGCAETSTPSTVARQLTATLLQYRDDIVANRLQLQITNGDDDPVDVAAVQFEWTGMDSEITDIELTIGQGQRVDLPVALQAPRCDIAGLVVQPAPAFDDASVTLTLVDGTTRTAFVSDPKGTALGIYAAGCEREMIEQQVSIDFDQLHEERVDGRPLTVGVLSVRRGLAIGSVSVLSVADTIVFRPSFPGRAASSPLLLLPADQDATEAIIRFDEGRCDAHAVAEAKQAFRFVVQVDLGDGVARSYVALPDPTLQEAMLATVAEGCAALALDSGQQTED